MDNEDKRARPFLGKWGGLRPFLGKRMDSEDKRARPFLGKRARPFLGKRSSLQDEDMEAILARAEHFLENEKRARPFLGKRSVEES